MNTTISLQDPGTIISGNNSDVFQSIMLAKLIKMLSSDKTGKTINIICSDSGEFIINYEIFKELSKFCQAQTDFNEQNQSNNYSIHLDYPSNIFIEVMSLIGLAPVNNLNHHSGDDLIKIIEIINYLMIDRRFLYEVYCHIIGNKFKDSREEWCDLLKLLSELDYKSSGTHNPFMENILSLFHDNLRIELKKMCNEVIANSKTYESFWASWDSLQKKLLHLEPYCYLSKEGLWNIKFIIKNISKYANFSNESLLHFLSQLFVLPGIADSMSQDVMNELLSLVKWFNVKTLRAEEFFTELKMTYGGMKIPKKVISEQRRRKLLIDSNLNKGSWTGISCFYLGNYLLDNSIIIDSSEKTRKILYSTDREPTEIEFKLTRGTIKDKKPVTNNHNYERCFYQPRANREGHKLDVVFLDAINYYPREYIFTNQDNINNSRVIKIEVTIMIDNVVIKRNWSWTFACGKQLFIIADKCSIVQFHLNKIVCLTKDEINCLKDGDAGKGQLFDDANEGSVSSGSDY